MECSLVAGKNDADLLKLTFNKNNLPPPLHPCRTAANSLFVKPLVLAFHMLLLPLKQMYSKLASKTFILFSKNLIRKWKVLPVFLQKENLQKFAYKSLIY